MSIDETLLLLVSNSGINREHPKILSWKYMEYHSSSGGSVVG
jgi:hypothetical protein